MLILLFCWSWAYLELLIKMVFRPCLLRVSTQPWSRDFINLCDSGINSLRGICVEIGPINHI